jgi:hypothetical protein
MDYYKDEYGNKLGKRCEPCGKAGLIPISWFYKKIVESIEKTKN